MTWTIVVRKVAQTKHDAPAHNWVEGEDGRTSYQPTFPNFTPFNKPSLYFQAFTSSLYFQPLLPVFLFLCWPFLCWPFLWPFVVMMWLWTTYVAILLSFGQSFGQDIHSLPIGREVDASDLLLVQVVRFKMISLLFSLIGTIMSPNK